MDLLCIFNIIKDMTYDFIRGISKMTMQGLRVQVSYYKTRRIEDIMLENTSLYNLDIAPKVRSSQ